MPDLAVVAGTDTEPPRAPSTKPVRPAKPARLAGATPARMRPLAKAVQLGFVRMAEGYGGHVTGGAKGTQDFDTRAMTEWCIAARFLAGGPHANTYAPTTEGFSALALWRQYQGERAGYVEAMNAWRKAQSEARKETGRKR